MLLKILIAVVKFLFPRLRIIAEYGIEEPAVFVCNHLGSFGPMAMMLYFPSAIRPWVSHRTMTKGLSSQQIAADIFRKEAKVPLWVRKALGKILEAPTIWAMKILHAIPVYYDAIRLGTTFSESMKTLRSGVSIAVFADKGGDHLDESVPEGIEPGCIYLAHFYARHSEKPLLLYPVHISRIKREIIVGKPIVFDRSNGTKNEIKRVGECLSKAIRELGAGKNEKKRRSA